MTPRTDLLASILVLSGLYYFITSFFLAKRSLPMNSSCNEASTLLQEMLKLTKDETQILHSHGILNNAQSTSGCWLPRQVDSLVVVVVDALRFDFALHHLPLSVGRRLQQIEQAKLANSNITSTSKLLQFVADPPTVTMQRLKALATGGLPTFADISNNMGGASLEEDTWIYQLKNTPFVRRNLQYEAKVAFAGDDTWIDLFGSDGFCDDQCFPYPSFNTRDLDTVDNGCLYHIPHFLEKLRTSENDKKDSLEVMILHFLGVDHVGHTYGPHNQHMDMKLHQMDVAMNDLLEYIDTSNDSCSMALIFGDHGMTEDGNHGGGTEEEINAALFIHTSPSCARSNTGGGTSGITTTMSNYGQTAFESIHQIDLVPTIALLLGLPIPYANLGSLVPSLLLFGNDNDDNNSNNNNNPAVIQTATALALNAAQVWRYYTVYSSTANALPNMSELEERLNAAVTEYKNGLQILSDNNADNIDSNSFHKASNLFKIFLMEALELGQKVWTRFDTVGMTIGASILLLGILFWIQPFIVSKYYYSSTSSSRSHSMLPIAQLWEIGLTALFIVFECGVLTFGNSYILEEEHILMYMIGVLGFVVYIRLAYSTTIMLKNYTTSDWWWLKLPLIIPFASRLGELFVSGHGMDPSVGVHNVHHPLIFLGSLTLLAVARFYMFRQWITLSFGHMLADCFSLLCLAYSWWEKRIQDANRTGFLGSRIAIAVFVTGFPISLYQMTRIQNEKLSQQQQTNQQITMVEKFAITSITKILIAIMIVTGPSSATSIVLYASQAWVVYWISKISPPRMVRLGLFVSLYNVPTLTNILYCCFLVLLDTGIIGCYCCTLEIYNSTYILCNESWLFL